MSKILFDALIPHGRVTTEVQDGVLKLTTQSSTTSVAYDLVGNCYKRHYLELPQKARIPFSLSMQLKLDYSGLIFLIGDGHVLFNCPSTHSIDDPIKPTGKSLPKGSRFDNRLPLNTFVNVTISFGTREMQVLIDGKEAFYSAKQPYMKAKELSQLNSDGFRLGFEIAKLSTLWVKDIELTEPVKEEPFSRPELYYSEEGLSEEERSSSEPVKPSFESFVARFPELLQMEIRETNELIKAQKCLKMKLSIDPRGEKITYTSADHGVSYLIRYTNGEWWQSYSFYVVTVGKAATWYRKADYMEELLQEISSSDPALAERIFYSLNDCVGCHGADCLVKTPYSFNGKKRVACHGIVMLRLCHEDFQDVRDFFRYLNKLIERKTAEGTLHTEKTLLMK